MTSISKNIYIDKLDDIVNKYNNTYHRTIKMKPIDVKRSIYIDFNKENKKDGPKFKIGDVRVLKYENVFSEGYVPNFSEEVFVIAKFKNIVPWTYVITDLKQEEIVGIFYEKELQKTNQKQFKVEKVLKRKGDQLYVKCKDYNSSFNIWIEKRDIIQMSEYLPEPKSSGINYATKADLRNTTGGDISKLAKKVEVLVNSC